MSKVYPSEEDQEEHQEPEPEPEAESEPKLAVIIKGLLHPRSTTSVLTVWKRSSMSFQGTDGFMAFDHRGTLVFRVDNYSRHSWSASRGGLVLMDAHGRVLLTLKPQLMMGMQQQWTGYRGDRDESSRAVFTMRRAKRSRDNNTTCEAEVFLGEKTSKPVLNVEGSFRSRNCKILTTHNRECVAKISRKRISSTVVLGDDVFTLTVQDGFDHEVMMALVMILDRISPKIMTPSLCS